MQLSYNSFFSVQDREMKKNKITYKLECNALCSAVCTTVFICQKQIRLGLKRKVSRWTIIKFLRLKYMLQISFLVNLLLHRHPKILNSSHSCFRYHTNIKWSGVEWSGVKALHKICDEPNKRSFKQ